MMTTNLSTPGQQDYFLRKTEIIKRNQIENPNMYKTGPTKYQDGANKGHWTPEEDEQLEIAVQKYNQKNWKKIAMCIKGRTDV